MSYTEFHKGKIKIVARGDEAIKKYIKDNNLEERLELDINEETGKIMLIKQYGNPFYILVAGYVNRGEPLENAVVREIKEETGMNVSHIKFNRTKFYEKSNTLMCNFTAFVKNDTELSTNNEIDSFHWFTKDDARKNILQNSLASYFLNAYLDE